MSLGNGFTRGGPGCFERDQWTDRFTIPQNLTVGIAYFDPTTQNLSSFQLDCDANVRIANYYSHLNGLEWQD